jgi:integrase
LSYGRKRITRKASGRNKTEAKDKLRELLREREEGATASATNYTVADAVREWLDFGLAGRSADTIANYRNIAEGHIIKPLGAKRLKGRTPHLSADDVDRWLRAESRNVSTRTLRLVHSILNRAIRRAMARDKAKRNVVILCEVPVGKSGRPSKSLTFDQAEALLAAAEKSTMDAYIAVSLLVGARTEELRALRWGEVDVHGRPDAKPPVPPSIAVYRSVRVGGDTKTTKSRRRLALPQRCVDVLRHHRERLPPTGIRRLRVRHRPRNRAGCAQRASFVPTCRSGRWSQPARVDTPGAAAQLRVAAVRERRPDRGHLPVGRAQRDRCHRARLPAPTACRAGRGCVGNGRHLPAG